MVGRNIQREFDVLNPAFSAALAETIAWCTRPDRPEGPSEALWSEALRPVAGPDARQEAEQGFRRGVWTPDDMSPTDILQRVRRVAAARRQCLAERRIPVPEADGALYDGRLLAHDPQSSVLDEASAMESKGFYDDVDGPGWDAWVMAFDAGQQRRAAGHVLILSWIPRDLQTTAAAGVLVNPVECIWWPPRSANAEACLRSILAGTAG